MTLDEYVNERIKFLEDFKKDYIIAYPEINNLHEGEWDEQFNDYYFSYKKLLDY